MWCISAVSRAAVSFSAGPTSLRVASSRAFTSVACIPIIVAQAQPFHRGKCCSCDRYHAYPMNVEARNGDLELPDEGEAEERHEYEQAAACEARELRAEWERP